MYSILENKFLINDSRFKKEFKTETFNGYKKSEVLSNLEKNILTGNIEKAILWGSELHCSGYCSQIYDRLYKIYIDEINKSNINMLLIFINEFEKIDKLDKKIFTRNSQFLRNHISNLICLLTFSTKFKLPKFPKINNDDFNMNNHKSKLITKSLRYIKQFLHKDDPRVVIIPLSEILLNLKDGSKSKSFDNCLFWLNWLITCEKKFHEGYMKCVRRTVKDVKDDFLNDFSWIIWDIILHVSPDNKHIKQLLSLFKRKFCKGKKSKKMKLFIYAFLIIIDPFPKIDFFKEIITLKDNEIRNKIIANINYQYFDILNNQQSNRDKYETEKIMDSKTKDSPFFSKEIFDTQSIEFALEQNKKKIKQNQHKSINIQLNKKKTKQQYKNHTSRKKVSFHSSEEIKKEDESIRRYKEKKMKKMQQRSKNVNLPFSLNDTLKNIDEKCIQF